MPTPQHQNFPWLTRVLYILTSPLQSKIAAQLCIAMCSMMTSLHTRLLKNIINRLRNGKAPGGDCAPNILLKNISRKTTVFLIYIYNSCLKLCYFPKSGNTQWLFQSLNQARILQTCRTIAQSALLALLVRFLRESF
jgi:hypothetical protein